MAKNNWNRIETLAAFALYCKLPFGKLHSRNPEIIALSKKLCRTPSAVSMKCCNLSSLDETHQRRGVRGMENSSAMDRTIWNEFNENPSAIFNEAIDAIQHFGIKVQESNIPDKISYVDGIERERTVRYRVNQYYFRSMIISSYNESCAVCGLPLTELLVASHIVPWSIDASLRMNPRNGLCLCGTHDRAYECGILRVDENYTIRLFLKNKFQNDDSVIEWLIKFEGKSIIMPQRWLPDPTFLKRKISLISNQN